MRKICLWCPSKKRMNIITRTHVHLFGEWTMILRKMVKKKPFLINPKHQYHAFRWEECVYDVQLFREWKLLQEYMLIIFGKQTMILRKMVEKKAFLKQNINIVHLLRRMCLWCPIMKGIEIVKSIQVCPCSR